IDFKEEEKQLYLDFAEILSNYIINHKNSYTPIEEPSILLGHLSNLIKNSSLEEYIQDNRNLINCFIKNSYTYSSRNDIPVSIIGDFYKFLKTLEISRQKIVLDN